MRKQNNNTPILDKLSNRGTNLTWLSRQLGIKYPTLYRYLNGTRAIPDGVIEKIEEATGIEIGEER